MDTNSSFQSLKHFCEDNPSIKKKLGLMTHHSEKSPDWIDRFILIIEYLQLLSQAFLSFPETILSFQRYEDTHRLFSLVLSFFKILNPSCILTYSNSDHLAFNILILILVVTMIKYIFIGEIICRTFFKKVEPPHFLLKSFWRWIYKLQTSLIYFLVTSFWIEALIGISKGEFTFLGSNKPWNIVFLSLLIGIEYFFSIILETQFCYLLPTQDFLSNKSFDLQIITLTQKLALQIVYSAFDKNSEAFIWVFSSLGLLFCCIRSLIYYKTLPLYHQEALSTQSDLLSLTNVSSIVCFIQAILWTSDYIQFNDNFYILTWIVLSILLIKISRGYLQNLILGLLVKNSTKLSPELQVHKIHLTKQYQKEFNFPRVASSNYDFKYLVLNTEKIQIESIFNVHTKDPDLHRVFLQSLEKLAEKFPHSSFVKLNIAYLCSKKNDLYAKAIKVLANIKQTTWSKFYLTVSFLYLRIEKSIMTNSKNTEEQLDLLTYIKSLVIVQELKREMLQQTQLTVGICKEILNEVSNIGKVFDHAQEIHKYRTKIQKKFQNLSTNIPDYFLEPLRLCAEYQLALNFSASDYGKYMELHTNKYSKYEKYFKNSTLIQENLYQNTNAFLLVSGGQKFDHGQIVFSTKSTEELCGISYKSHISSLFPLHLQTFFTEFFKQISESGGDHRTSLLNKVFTTFVYNKNGYITEADIFVRFHPYITEDLFLNVVIRPILNAEECLLIQENGDIVGATKLLAKRLHLTRKNNKLNSINLKSLSEELSEVNEALNLLQSLGGVNIDEKIGENVEIHAKEDASNIEAKLSSPARKRNHHQQGLSYEKAIDVYHNFYKIGQEISISPLQNTSSNYYFHCTVSFIQFGSTILKRLHLNPTFRENQELLKSEEDSLNNPDMEEFNHNKETNSLFGSENIDDCHEVKKGEELYTEWKVDAPLNTYHNLLTPKSQGDLPLLLLNPQKIMMTTNNDPDPDPAVVSELVFSEQLDEPVKNFQRKQTMKQELIDSDPYQERIEENTYTTFNRAISTKSYPKAFNLLCSIYFFLVLLILCSQVILKVISDNTTDNLKVKKEMLNSAQIRTFCVVKVQADSRGIITLISGIVLPGQTGNTGQNTTQLLDLTKSYLDKIVTADNNIRRNINYLNHEIKDLLFLQDVGIVGSYNDLENQDSQNVTTFQAVDILQTALSKAYKLPTIQFAQGYQIFHFIVQNTINDIVYKNNIINERFIESVNEEKNDLQAIIMLCLIIVPIILLFIYLSLIYIVWTQYSIKKSNMLAFVKLHPNRVKNLMQSLNKFADLLTDKELLPEKGKPKLSAALNPHHNNSVAYHKNHIIKSVNYSQMVKRYYKYTLLITLYVLILFAIIFVNFISASHSTKIIYKKQQQLQFANQLSVGCIVGYISMVELFVSNDTNSIQHLSPQDSLIKTLGQIDDYQKEANTIFMNSNDGDYDPQVSALLFNSNECSELTGIFQFYCQDLVDSGQSGSIVQALSLLRSSLDAGLSSYQAANKTSLPYLISVGLRNYEKVVLSANVVAAKSQLISKIIDAQLNKSITDANNQRSVLLAVFIVGLAFAVILIWYQVLMKVREVNNDFKKVLKTFPPNFILSSFLLKTFLRDNSQTVFDL